MSHSEELTWVTKGIRFWLIILIICQFLDGGLTYYCLSNSPLGIHGEGNLIVRYMMHHMGLIQALIVSKGAAITACLTLSPRKTKFELLVIRCLVFIYIGVIASWLYVLNNILFL